MYPQPPAEVAFSSDNWTVFVHDVEQCVAETMWTIRQFLPLFPKFDDLWFPPD